MHIPATMDIEPDARSLFSDCVNRLSETSKFERMEDVLTSYDAGRTRLAGLLISEIESAELFKHASRIAILTLYCCPRKGAPESLLNLCHHYVSMDGVIE